MIRASDSGIEKTNPLPAQGRIIFQGAVDNQGYIIRRVELRRYSIVNKPTLEPSIQRANTSDEYSRITAVVETDRGTVEMDYLESRGGPEVLESAANLLTGYIGISALVNRAILELMSSDDP